LSVAELVGVSDGLGVDGTVLGYSVAELVGVSDGLGVDGKLLGLSVAELVGVSDGLGVDGTVLGYSVAELVGVSDGLGVNSDEASGISDGELVSSTVGLAVGPGVGRAREMSSTAIESSVRTLPLVHALMRPAAPNDGSVDESTTEPPSTSGTATSARTIDTDSDESVAAAAMPLRTRSTFTSTTDPSSVMYSVTGERSSVGVAVVGAAEGALVGARVGTAVGATVGLGVVGATVGEPLGTDGSGVGAGLGVSVGDSLGDGVGDGVGAGLGCSVGKLVGDGVGEDVGTGVQASVLQATASLSAALQACATPAEAVATDRARLAAPYPQGTVQLLHAVQAELAQSVHVKAAHGMVSVSPPHWAPPKAAASIMYFKRDEEPAAPQTQVNSHSDTRACGRKRLASTDACERTCVHHALTSPRLQNRSNHAHAKETRLDL
jgi:hypothetical protein